LLAGCGGSDQADRTGAARGERRETGPIVIYAVNYPLAYFAERIGGDEAVVQLPIPPDSDPAYWSPDAETVADYQSADLILLNGAGYAGWTSKVSLPTSKLVNTSSSFEDMYILAEEAVLHTHGPAGEHEHTDVAFTTWLDPMLAIEQARAIRDALSALRPAEQEGFDARFGALESDLAALDSRLEAVAGRWGERPVLGSHPVYQYLARRYDLNLRSVHFEPDVVPGPGAWRELAGLLAEHPADVMLWESAPLTEAEVRLWETLGVGSVVFDPCGNRPQLADFLSVMSDNVEALEAL
jgi:zinc transport system substrate-binding protein